MITMARIQGHSLGHAGWQRPIFPLTLGQNGAPSSPPSTSFGPPSYAGQGPSFAATPSVNPVDAALQFPAFPAPVYPPAYAFPVTTDPVVVETPAQTPPNWALIAGGVAAGVVLALLLT